MEGGRKRAASDDGPGARPKRRARTQGWESDAATDEEVDEVEMGEGGREQAGTSPRRGPMGADAAGRRTYGTRRSARRALNAKAAAAVGRRCKTPTRGHSIV